MSRKSRDRVKALLEECGIEIDGPSASDIQVFNEEFYARVLARGSLGLGESYMDGWWNARSLDGFIYRLLSARLDERARTWRDVAAYCTVALFNLQRRGQHVLDVGCGGAVQLAAARHGAVGTGITVSREQAEYARRMCDGLPVTILLQDYRGLSGSFDHIFSIGMFEHVGVKNYRTFMSRMHCCLNRGGRFLLHTIGTPHSTNHTDPWIERYIFPNSMISSQRQISAAIDGLFLIDGLQRLGQHYDRTLLEWRANFERHWSELAAGRGARLFRMWRFYLSASAAAFRARRLDVWQLLLVPQ